MKKVKLSQEKNKINAETIGDSVDKLILRLLSEQMQKLYSRKTSLIELELARKQMDELHSLLCNEFSVDLHPTFFIQNCTPEAGQFN